MGSFLPPSSVNISQKMSCEALALLTRTNRKFRITRKGVKNITESSFMPLYKSMVHSAPE